MSASSIHPWQVLGQGAAPTWLSSYPKIAGLHELRRQGLKVPLGWFARGDAAQLRLPEPGAGPWILRSVMPGEDRQDALLTGLSRSVPNLRSQQELEDAVQDCQAHQRALQHQGILPHANPNELAWLLQRQVAARCLAIAIFDQLQARWYLECYAPGDDPFSGEQTPFFRGDRMELTDADLSPNRLNTSLTQVHKACPKAPGLEVELVLDAQGRWHCVQAKTLGTSPSAGHQSFLDAANAQLAPHGRSLQDYAQLELDAEHNPEPLSPAHTWLMAALTPAGAAPDYLVLCGWLYQVKSPPARPGKEPVASPLPEGALASVLHDLSQTLLPKARSSLAAFDANWPSLARADIPALIDDALTRCKSILADRRARVDSLRAQKAQAAPREDFSFSATLSSKADFADVLPTRWDICAPSLSHASLPDEEPQTQMHRSLPADPATRWALLEEWDDHLFALALELVRRAWLKIATTFEIPEALVFFVSKPALTQFAKGELSKDALLDRCQQAQRVHARQCALNAPRLLLRGHPALLAKRSRVHGLGFGASLRATLYKRRDLQELLSHPPPPESSILAIPALTAPAALALHRLKIRAVVTQYGGVASHGARMAAELGMSAIIGCDACMELPEGASVWLDTRAGRIWWIRDA